VSAAIRTELAGETARRIAVALAVTGPLLGLCWIANAWANALPPWQHHLTGPWLGLPLLGLAFLIAMPSLLVTLAGTGRLSRWMSLPPGASLTTAATAAIAAAIADVTLLTMFTTHALTGSGDLHWVPVALAVMASLARMTFAARAARHCLGSRAALT
ncbi:hypothetical protein, partial [Actinomadura sp. HBU206391]|uniref:hypothetical protein n=1 Tax=Actinomadura sp. HBU206391 TaxID=2731692 RepID=UPI00164FD5C6